MTPNDGRLTLYSRPFYLRPATDNNLEVQPQVLKLSDIGCVFAMWVQEMPKCTQLPLVNLLSYRTLRNGRSYFCRSFGVLGSQVHSSHSNCEQQRPPLWSTATSSGPRAFGYGKRSESPISLRHKASGDFDGSKGAPWLVQRRSSA